MEEDNGRNVRYYEENICNARKSDIRIRLLRYY